MPQYWIKMHLDYSCMIDARYFVSKTDKEECDLIWGSFKSITLLENSAFAESLVSYCELDKNHTSYA